MSVSIKDGKNLLKMKEKKQNRMKASKVSEIVINNTKISDIFNVVNILTHIGVKCHFTSTYQIISYHIYNTYDKNDIISIMSNI